MFLHPISFLRAETGGGGGSFTVTDETPTLGTTSNTSVTIPATSDGDRVRVYIAGLTADLPSAANNSFVQVGSNVTQSSSIGFSVWERYFATGTGSFTMTFTHDYGHMVTFVSTFSGGSSTSGSMGTSNSASFTSTASANSITATAGSIVDDIHASRNTITSPASGSGVMNERQGSQVTLVVRHTEGVSAGATGAKTATLNSSGAWCSAQLEALA